MEESQDKKEEKEIESTDPIADNLKIDDNAPKNEDNLSWFQRLKKGISTTTSEKKEMPEGLWVKCPECSYICTAKELEDNLWVCPKCGYHHRIESLEYFKIMFDDKKYTELFDDVISTDFLGFTDLKPYQERLDKLYASTDLKDSMRVAKGSVAGNDLVIACMDFAFIGGSLGSVMGEKFARGVDYAIKHKIPFMVISKSGGARMMESAYSLMQMAKTSAKLNELSDAKLPFFSMLTDPTFGGVTASFAMLGDLNFAEPGALIGFAGPRVIKETIRKDLPKGFQKSEFLLDHGFLDFIVHRHDLKERVGMYIRLLK